MVTIESKFIGDFKLGDNICHNLNVAQVLYDKFDESDAEERRLLCKPIVVLLASVLEAVLYDFHKRVKTFTIEGVKNLTADAIDYIRLADIDDFAKYIDSARKQKLFGAVEKAFYEKMHDIRKLRNRVYIQNEKQYVPRDEYDAFTLDAKRLAEQVTEKAFRTLAAHFSRDHNYVAEFVLPWDPHYPI